MAETMSAAVLFELAMDWLLDNYDEHRFFTERDVVWTLQRHLEQRLAETNMPWRVFHDYPILPGPRRALCADIA